MTNAMTTTSAIQTAGKAKSKLSPRRKVYEVGMRTLLYLSAGATCLLLLFLIGYIFVEGMPNLTWEFLTTEESVLNDTVGILPAIQNTVYVVVVTLLFALPLGVGAAIYLTEYATNRKLVTAIEFATETLAGIPSILYALVGMLVFCQLMKLGTTLLAGSLTLVIMTLPTIIRTTQESLKTVPQGYREGALGLGAGKWHMIRTIVLPDSIDGIVTGCILSIGRVRRADVHRRYEHRPAGFFQQGRPHPQLRRHPHRGPVWLRQGERPLRSGFLCGSGAAGYYPGHQSGRQAGGQASQEVRSFTI